MFNQEQLAFLLGVTGTRKWVGGEISDDRTPEIYRYLTQKLAIEELRPESVLQKLTAQFLELQPDGWISRPYGFLSNQRVLHGRAKSLPLIRLDNGKHVEPILFGCKQAFLPGSFDTAFPTVRKTVCWAEEARAFLLALGLTEPDPVDDVIWNILPKYKPGTIQIADGLYAADIQRILAAHRTDSDGRRRQLVDVLGQAAFVRTIDARSDQMQRTALPGPDDDFSRRFAPLPTVSSSLPRGVWQTGSTNSSPSGWTSEVQSRSR